MRTIAAATLALLAASCASTPSAPAGTDADTAAWWAITGDLSSDAMEGRDTGSPGYDRAAKYVADRFAALGLKPAGENGGWFQTLPLKEVRMDKGTTRFEVITYHGDGDLVGSRVTKRAVGVWGRSDLEFLHEITVRPSWTLPATGR